MIKRSTHARIAAVFCLAFLSSLTVFARPVDPVSNEELLIRLGELQQISWAGRVSQTDNGSFGACSKTTVNLTVGDAMTGLTRPLSVTVIRPDSSSLVPAMILVPTVEGVTIIERKVASHFCDMNIATIIADVNEAAVPELIPLWGHEDEVSRRSILSLRTIIDYATTSSEFDAKRVGLMGLSLGAITSSFLAGIESERLAAVVLVLAGGDVPFILATSDNKYAVRIREERMSQEKMSTVDEYEEKLHQTMRYDPMHFSRLAKTKRLFMVLSDNDTKVPSVVQQDLFTAFGAPSSTTFSISHVETIVSLTFFYFDYVSNFVKQRFSESPTVSSLYHLRVPIRTVPTLLE